MMGLVSQDIAYILMGPSIVFSATASLKYCHYPPLCIKMIGFDYTIFLKLLHKLASDALFL